VKNWLGCHLQRARQKNCRSGKTRKNDLDLLTVNDELLVVL